MGGRAEIVYVADSNKAIADLAKLVAQQEKVIQKLRETVQPARGAASALDGIASSVATFVSLSAAISLTTRELGKLQASRDEAVSRSASQADAQKKLIQISGGDPAKLAKLRATAEGLRGEGLSGVDALDTAFTGTSLQFTPDEIARFGKMFKFASDIRPFMTASAGLSSAFGEKGAEFASPEKSTAALLAAAGSSLVEAQKIAQEALGAAVQVGALGGSPQELLAAMAPLAVAVKDVSQATTAIGAFADIVARDKRFGSDIGLFGAVDLVDSMTEAEQKKLLGSTRQAKRGFGLLSANRAAAGRALTSINAAIAGVGTNADIVAASIALGTGDIIVGMGDIAAAAESKRKAQEERDLTPAQRLRNIQQETVREMQSIRGRGGNILSQLDLSMAAAFDNLIGKEFGPRHVEQMRAVGAVLDDPRIDAVIDRFAAAVELFQVGTQSMEAAAGRISQTDHNRDGE